MPATRPTAMTTDAGLYRLFAWLSPAFPTGAFSYSHGLEAAGIEGRAGLEAWIAAVVTQGSGRIDADIFRDAYRAAASGDGAALDDANRRGLAYRGSAELALEAAAQGAAFLAALRAAWPAPALAAWRPEEVCHAAAVGAAAAAAGIALETALVLYLHAFAANLTAAGMRLGLIGQTDGQRILAALEPAVRAAATASLSRAAGDFGAATVAAELASMAHETQYSRLFRS